MLLYITSSSQSVIFDKDTSYGWGNFKNVSQVCNHVHELGPPT